MKCTLPLILSLLLTAGCQKNHSSKNQPTQAVSIKYLIKNLEDASNEEVIVIAHRGDWRNAPENSLQAIQNCITMGVDMVEIDVRETKDRQLVLMHDETIDRTTKASGYVTDWTLDRLRTLKLLDGLGIETQHGIPTLEEALLVAKDKILINLDKSYEIFDKCYEVVKKTGTLDQVIIKGNKSRAEVEQEFGAYLDEVYFMPVLYLSDSTTLDVVDDYIENRPPVAFEFIVEEDGEELRDYFEEVREKGSGVWVNALWPRLCAGYDDERAALDPTIYDWYIENNVDLIQTDRPAVLLEYLRRKGLHR